MGLTPTGERDFSFLTNEQVFWRDGEVNAIIVMSCADYLRDLTKNPEHSGDRTALSLAVSPRGKLLTGDEWLDQEKWRSIDFRIKYGHGLGMLKSFSHQQTSAEPIDRLPASCFVEVRANHSKQVIATRLAV
jgi:hypothetical protein